MWIKFGTLRKDYPAMLLLIIPLVSIVWIWFSGCNFGWINKKKFFVSNLSNATGASPVLRFHPSVGKLSSHQEEGRIVNLFFSLFAFFRFRASQSLSFECGFKFFHWKQKAFQIPDGMKKWGKLSVNKIAFFFFYCFFPYFTIVESRKRRNYSAPNNYKQKLLDSFS